MNRRHADRRRFDPWPALALLATLGHAVVLLVLLSGPVRAATTTDAAGFVYRTIEPDTWSMIGSGSCAFSFADVGDALPLEDRGITWEAFCYDGTDYWTCDALEAGEGAWLLQRTGAPIELWVP